MPRPARGGRPPVDADAGMAPPYPFEVDRATAGGGDQRQHRAGADGQRHRHLGRPSRAGTAVDTGTIRLAGRRRRDRASPAPIPAIRAAPGGDAAGEGRLGSGPRTATSVADSLRATAKPACGVAHQQVAGAASAGQLRLGQHRQRASAQIAGDPPRRDPGAVTLGGIGDRGQDQATGWWQQRRRLDGGLHAGAVSPSSASTCANGSRRIGVGER